jgi:hypothetical protein
MPRMESEKPLLSYASPAPKTSKSWSIPRVVMLGFLGAVGGVAFAVAVLVIFKIDAELGFIPVLAACGAVGLIGGVVLGAIRDHAAEPKGSQTE